MSGKDESIYSKEALAGTSAGKEILKQGLLRSKGFRQFYQYKEKADHEFASFERRFVSSLHKLIESDLTPRKTLDQFAAEIGSTDLVPTGSAIESGKQRLSRVDALEVRVKRILDSNFVKMTFPVFQGLFDASSHYYSDEISDQKMESVIDGHIIAIDLSEPMDRIADKDEDLEFLEDYKFMNPYILALAREKIAEGGDAVLKEFEAGFRDARHGQYVDIKLKANPSEINDEKMVDCYKKYRAVMGTAGANMALKRRPLCDIFRLGMARAGESVGCGNEIEDSIKNGFVKVPSWPLYFALNTLDVHKAFELTLAKSQVYLDEAKLALDMLPERFEFRPFLEFLFLSVQHYNQYWFNILEKRSLYDLLQKQFDEQMT